MHRAEFTRWLQWVDERKPKLVIIDPLRNFHSQDENDSGAMYGLLRTTPAVGN